MLFGLRVRVIFVVGIWVFRCGNLGFSGIDLGVLYFRGNLLADRG